MIRRCALSAAFYRIIISLGFTVCTSVYLVASALGQTSDDRNSSVESIGISHKGVNSNELVSIRVGNHIFDVPAGYLPSWPTREMVGRINEKNSVAGLGFTFWVPSGLPVLLKTEPFFIRRRPVHPQQSSVPADEFAVLVQDWHIARDGEQDLITPEKQFKNVESTSQGQLKLGTSRFGLQSYKVDGNVDYERYRQVPNGGTELLLTCAAQTSPLPNPNCIGYFYSIKDRITFWLEFSTKDLAFWREIISKAKQLGRQWKRKG